MKDRLLKRLQPFGQEHLLRFWDELAVDAQLGLAQQIEQVDFACLSRLLQGDVDTPDWAALAGRAQPPQAIRLASNDGTSSAQEARSQGEAALRRGCVGMILVAGGQGTRLGFDHPKGMLPLGPVSGRTLFEILIDRLLAMSARYQVSIPLFLMTSPATHDETVQFFREHDFFGLAEEDVHTFCQGVMPAVDADSGKVLLAEPGSLFLSPDGHGGMLQAFHLSGGLQAAKQQGIELLFYGQVDNPLLQVCNPSLLGYHLLAESQMTTQVVQKSGPMERVGNVVDVDGRTRIIEYRDLPEAIARGTRGDGSLLLWAGNLAVHVFDLGFLERTAQQDEVLPFHKARKKADCIDASGRTTSTDSIKFERFIFDLLPAAENAIVVEAVKERAFAPVKNANHASSDTPQTAQHAMVKLDAAMLREAGMNVTADIDVEVNPRWATTAEEVASHLAPGTNISKATYFGCGE